MRSRAHRKLQKGRKERILRSVHSPRTEFVAFEDLSPEEAFEEDASARQITNYMVEAKRHYVKAVCLFDQVRAHTGFTCTMLRLKLRLKAWSFLWRALLSSKKAVVEAGGLEDLSVEHLAVRGAILSEFTFFDVLHAVKPFELILSMPKRSAHMDLLANSYLCDLWRRGHDMVLAAKHYHHLNERRTRFSAFERICVYYPMIRFCLAIDRPAEALLVEAMTDTRACLVSNEHVLKIASLEELMVK